MGVIAGVGVSSVAGAGAVGLGCGEAGGDAAGVGFGSDSAPVGVVGVGTIVGVGVAVGFGRETASGSVTGDGSEALSIDTDCPRPDCVIAITLMPKLTKTEATRVMGMDRSTDVSRLNGPPPHGWFVGRLRGSTSLQSTAVQKIRGRFAAVNQ